MPTFFRPIVPATAAVLAAAGLTGCTADRHTFNSTQTAPKTVDITYVQTGETAWSYDIPAGQKLTLEFSRDGQFSGFKVPNTPADGMKWYLSSLGSGNDMSGHPGKFGAQDSGTVELTGAPIQMNVSVRDPLEPDDTPPPIEVVPPPVLELEDVDEAPPPPPAPAMEDEVPAPPAMEEVEEPMMDEPVMGDAVEAVEEAAAETAEMVEEAAEEVPAPEIDK